jgi:hypothetical protein
LQFAKWTQEGVFFVCRLKDNAKEIIQEVLFEQELSGNAAGVMKVEHIHFRLSRHWCGYILSVIWTCFG